MATCAFVMRKIISIEYKKCVYYGIIQRKFKVGRDFYDGLLHGRGV